MSDQPGLFDGEHEHYLRHRRLLREKEAKHCPCCEQRIREWNPHHMDRSKVEVLEGVARLNLAGHPWVKLQRDGRLIHPDDRESTIQCDDVHGTRLMWFGLLRRKAIRTGLYQVTGDGLRFLQGRHRVPAEILCRDGIVIVEHPEELQHIGEVRNVILDREYWNAYPGEQVSRWDVEEP
jgi:hypothetical protein